VKTVRLTLRTLLSYLDDMLEPGQAKAIGAKVAESEHAREQMERIKQVTRRRKLTAPPTSGPGGIDPNTIAEYLDNEVTPETAAEVEQICLASDVHLAEVAACHQILTLVLGEPALVPPSAKQKMYALVKGPESIPFRKPPKPSAKEEDQDLSSEIELDHDEALRLGVKPVGRNDGKQLALFIAGGLAAVCLLVVAIWMLVANLGPSTPKGTDQVARNDDKPNDANTTDQKVDDKKKQPNPEDPKKDDANKGDPKKGDPNKDNVADKDKKKTKPEPEWKQGEVVPVEIKPLPELKYVPASTKQQPIGLYLPDKGVPTALLQAKADRTGWVRPVIKDKLPEVVSGRPLLGLPGTTSKVIVTATGVEVTLWGNLPELTLDSTVLESLATIHANDQLDADLTLHRGRVKLANKKDGDARVRLRVENPSLKEEQFFDITLHGKDTEVIIERLGVMSEEPFFEDPKDPMRKGPIAVVKFFASRRSATVRGNQHSYSLDKTSQPMLLWDSRQALLGPPPPNTPQPPWLLEATPTLKGDAEIAMRKKAVAAADFLTGLIETKPVDVALAEAEQTIKQEAQKELGLDKRISPDTFARWRQIIRCYAATDDAAYLFEEFAHEKTPAAVRGIYLQHLHHWLAQHRDHDDKLFRIVQKSYKRTVSIKIMELFHPLSAEDQRNPATYQHLIENLNNDLLPIRALSQLHLYALAPAGRNIPFDPGMSAQQRSAAVREWTRVLPPGTTPTTAPAPKKEKS
jgi:hypothetical protein